MIGKSHACGCQCPHVCVEYRAGWCDDSLYMLAEFCEVHRPRGAVLLVDKCSVAFEELDCVFFREQQILDEEERWVSSSVEDGSGEGPTYSSCTIVISHPFQMSRSPSQGHHLLLSSLLQAIASMGQKSTTFDLRRTPFGERSEVVSAFSGDGR